jgi:hypothetical protein
MRTLEPELSNFSALPDTTFKRSVTKGYRDVQTSTSMKRVVLNGDVW